MVCLIQDPLNTYDHAQRRRGKHTVIHNDDPVPILPVQRKDKLTLLIWFYIIINRVRARKFPDQSKATFIFHTKHIYYFLARTHARTHTHTHTHTHTRKLLKSRYWKV